MNRDDVYQQYFSWLISRIEYQDYCVRYKRLLGRMYEAAFDSGYRDDQNRISDAYKLRELYLDFGCSLDEIDFDFLSMRPSVLEVFVAVCERVENDIMQDDELGNRTGEWFWRFLEWVGVGHGGGQDWTFLSRWVGLNGQNVPKRGSIWAEMCNFLNNLG